MFKNLSEYLKFIDLNCLRKYFFKILFRVIDFRIFVNDIFCFVDDINGERYEINYIFEGIGIIMGFYIIVKIR